MELVRAHVQSLFPTILWSWYLIFCFLLYKDKNQTFISSLLEGSIGSRYIFTYPQKWLKTRFLRLLTLFFSKTRANFLLPSPDSTGKNLSKSVIIGQVPKSMSYSVIGFNLHFDFYNLYNSNCTVYLVKCTDKHEVIVRRTNANAFRAVKVSLLLHAYSWWRVYLDFDSIV